MVNMKKKSILLSLLLAIFVVGGMFAQEPTYSKMSPYTRILLDKLAKKDTANSLLRSSISGDYLSAFVKVATDEGWASLDSAGCRIRTRTGDIATVLIPLSAVESVSELGCIQYVSASQPMRASMDSARYYSDVADAYAGTKLPQPYTGKGVIVGVVDSGFDFTHRISMTRRVKRIVSNKFGTKRVLIVKRNTGRKRNCWMRLARLIRM